MLLFRAAAEAGVRTTETLRDMRSLKYEDDGLAGTAGDLGAEWGLSTAGFGGLSTNRNRTYACQEAIKPALI